MGQMTIGEEIYASTNKLGVNLKVMLDLGLTTGKRQLRMETEPKLVTRKATGVGGGGIPPAPTIGLGKKMVTRSETGLCVGMSALWCANLIKGEKDPGDKTIQEREKETKPNEGRAHFIQARWDQIFKKQWRRTRPKDWHRDPPEDPYMSTPVRVKEELMEFKAFLEGIGMDVTVTVPAKVQFDAQEIDAMIANWPKAPATFMVFCPGHCIAVNRSVENGEGLRNNNYIFDPDRGMYRYTSALGLETEFTMEFAMNDKYRYIPPPDDPNDSEDDSEDDPANLPMRWNYLQIGPVA